MLPAALPETQQTFRQKRIRLAPPHERVEEGLTEQQDCNDDRERELEASREKLVRVEAENEDGGGGYTIGREQSAIDKEAGQEQRGHQSRADARRVQTGD